MTKWLAFCCLFFATASQAPAQLPLASIMQVLDQNADAQRAALATDILVHTLTGDIDWGWTPPSNKGARFGETTPDDPKAGGFSRGWGKQQKILIRKDLINRLVQLLSEMEDCAFYDIVLSILKHEIVHTEQEIPPGTSFQMAECEAYLAQAAYLCFALFDADCYSTLGGASETVCRFMSKIRASANERYDCGFDQVGVLCPRCEDEGY